MDRPRKSNHIPGYSGHLSGIKAENVYAETYGRTSKASMAGAVARGADVSAEDRYTSTNTAHFTDQRALNAMLRAQQAEREGTNKKPVSFADERIQLSYEEAKALAAEKK